MEAMAALRHVDAGVGAADTSFAVASAAAATFVVVGKPRVDIGQTEQLLVPADSLEGTPSWELPSSYVADASSYQA